jgi:hypothetical protein
MLAGKCQVAEQKAWAGCGGRGKVRCGSKASMGEVVSTVQGSENKKYFMIEQQETGERLAIFNQAQVGPTSKNMSVISVGYLVHFSMIVKKILLDQRFLFYI